MTENDIILTHVTSLASTCTVSAVPYRVIYIVLRLFYGCSYRFHLSGDNSRDRYIKGSC